MNKVIFLSLLSLYCIVLNAQVGIGTVNPSYDLDIAGDVNINKDITAGVALRVNSKEAIYFNGSLFSWGYGGNVNYFQDIVTIGSTNYSASKLQVTKGFNGEVSPLVVIDQHNCGSPCGQGNGVSLLLRNENTTDNQIGATLGWAASTAFTTVASGIRAVDRDVVNNRAGIAFMTNGEQEQMRIKPNGNIGIGYTNPQERLHVNGNILANGTITPDYVFKKYYNGVSKLKPNYEMMRLDSLEIFVKKNKHLPGVPSSKEVIARGGIVINKAVEINLEKIEELFLHILELKKENENLKRKFQELNELISIKE